MELDGYIRELSHEGEAFEDAARSAGLDASVPTCPGWTVRHLLAHLGYVHRWATMHLAGALGGISEDLSEEEIYARRPPDGEIFEWFALGRVRLVEALQGAPADLQCWTFMAASSPLCFWARRQAHETAIHRVDAGLACGSAPGEFAQDFAIDGIDELLVGFAPRRRPRVDDLNGWAVQFKVDGAPDCWTVRSGPEKVTTAVGPAPASCTVSGPASELYLALWNRIPPERLRVEGDEQALARWVSFMHVRW